MFCTANVLLATVPSVTLYVATSPDVYSVIFMVTPGKETSGIESEYTEAKAPDSFKNLTLATARVLSPFKSWNATVSPDGVASSV